MRVGTIEPVYTRAFHALHPQVTASNCLCAAEVSRKYTNRGIELRVTFPSSRVVILSTGANDLVELLMWKIFCAVGFAPEDQLLVLKGKQLSREQSLSAQGVRDGDTILVVRRVRNVY